MPWLGCRSGTRNRSSAAEPEVQRPPGSAYDHPGAKEGRFASIKQQRLRFRKQPGRQQGVYPAAGLGRAQPARHAELEVKSVTKEAGSRFRRILGVRWTVKRPAGQGRSGVIIKPPKIGIALKSLDWQDQLLADRQGVLTKVDGVERANRGRNHRFINVQCRDRDRDDLPPNLRTGD